MAIDPKFDVRQVFKTADSKTEQAVPEVPEHIKKHAPKPVLRPGGSWAADADAVDQRVREQQDAAKAQNKWNAGVKRKPGRGMRMGFRHSVKGED